MLSEQAKSLKHGIFSFLIPLSLILSACDGAGGESSDRGTPVKLISAEEAQRFLTKSTFGATPSEIERLRTLGYEAWIDEQFSIPQTEVLTITDTAVQKREVARRQRLMSEGESNPDVLARGIGKGQEAASRMDAWWHAAINGKDQLRQRMAFALSQIFVVSDSNGDSSLRNRAYSRYHDILAENALGNYRQLIEDVTINPAMATFLSLRGSIRFGFSEVTGLPDENYAREALQLFSIGLVELNLDGTAKLANGREIETYDQELIGNFARVYTGWQVPTGRLYDGYETDELQPWGGEPNSFHDYDSKLLFDNKLLAADLTTRMDLSEAMDSIFHHPNVAPFISRQLIQRFVTSNPDPAYVERVATVFNDNGEGVRGDLFAVIKAILLDSDSLNSHSDKNGGKLKEPLLRISQIWRAFNAESVINYIRFSIPDRFTGQRPIGAPSVFNFYEPTYAPSGAIEDAGLVAPEFSLMSDGLNIAYLNKLAQIARSTEFGDQNTVYTTNSTLAMKLDLSKAKQLSNNHDELMDYYNELLFGGLMSQELRSIVITYLENIPGQTDASSQSEMIAEEALVLLTASPEFSIQR